MSISEDEPYIMIGTGVSPREALRMAEAHASILICVVDDFDTTPTDMSSLVIGLTRRCGKSEMAGAYSLSLYAPDIPPESRSHYNQNIVQYFRGPIMRMTTINTTPRLNLKVKCGAIDRKVNKRKNYLKSLRA